MKKLIEFLFYQFYRCNAFEPKLNKYQGYRPKTILPWKRQTKLKWRTVKKILKEIRLYDGVQIRNILRSLVDQHNELFHSGNVYITSFGEFGKSGGKIIYEFKHALQEISDKIIEPWKIPQLPENSKIIFIDDLIGTGLQSTEFIQEKLYQILNPSHKAYLLCICATPDGKNKVENESGFEILCHELLIEDSHQYFSEKCKIFTEDEKRSLKTINEALSSKKTIQYDKGLLIAFYYSVPNNTMPIIWKDNYPFLNYRGERKKWVALMPREY